MSLRIGFIGCGLIARSHARRLLEVDEASVASAFDVDEERLRAFASEHEAMAAASAEEVIESSDAIYVTTWTAAHPEFVSMVADAGKPVFCEKPLAVDLPSTRSMVEAVEDAEVVNQVGLILRHSPAFRWMQHHVSSGEFGPAMSVVFRDDQYIPVQGLYGSTWRGDRTLAGSGTLLEHSIHDLDLIDWIIGPIAEVSCVTHNHHGIDGIEDQATVTLRAGSGALAVLSSTWHDVLSRPSQRLVEVFCRDGYFGLEGDWLGPIRHDVSGSERVEEHGDAVIEMAAALDGKGTNPDAHFVAAVLEGRPASPDFATALRAHTLADAAYRSAAQGGLPVSGF